jgi:hypothetical protein
MKFLRKLLRHAAAKRCRERVTLHVHSMLLTSRRVNSTTGLATNTPFRLV